MKILFRTILAHSPHAAWEVRRLSLCAARCDENRHGQRTRRGSELFCIVLLPSCKYPIPNCSEAELIFGCPFTFHTLSWQ
ncbi:hypothetical protein AHF37_04217 [Paragonimus kellicotti]|nr:hypothetical protein AHF37_04217 [Paragonimus kellicotti]